MPRNKRTKKTVYLALGTNLGNKEKNLNDAITLIGKEIGKVVKVASFLETKPEGFVSENNFLNTAIECSTYLSPRQLLEKTKQIEVEMGRTIKSQNGIYHDRIIDIDILIYDSLSIHDDDLVIPHPRMKERNFVMIPLREIANIPNITDSQH